MRTRLQQGVNQRHAAVVHTSALPSAAKPYNAEFYFDTPNPVRIQKANNYSYNLQWTQRDPEATDRIIGYWLTVRKVRLASQVSPASRSGLGRWTLRWTRVVLTPAWRSVLVNFGSAPAHLTASSSSFLLLTIDVYNWTEHR